MVKDIMCGIGHPIIICLFLIKITTSSGNIISVEKKEIVTRIGDEVKLICSSEQERIACSFTSPRGRSYNILEGNNYDNLRIQAYETENNQYDCAMLITSVKQSDEGTWKCNVTTSIPYYQIGTNSIKVIIGTPPPPIEINSGNDITVEKKEIVTRIGDEVKLICSSEQENIACSFTSPNGRSYNMLKGNHYDNSRIQAYETGNKDDCAMMITNVTQSDIGTWNCNVTTSTPFYQIGRNSIELKIETPPPAPIAINLNDNQPISIKCNSPGALPAIYYVCEGSCLCKISGSNRGKILYCDNESENEEE